VLITKRTGEYRYHRAFPAYENLRSNALLALDGSPGHVTEVLSGNYYQGLSTSSPHQIWSAAMIISPILRGLFGLQTDASRHHVIFAPHVPADWNSFAIHNVRVGDSSVDFDYRRTLDEITLAIQSSGAASLDFSPAVSPRARILNADLNGARVPFQISRSDTDQHVEIPLSIAAGKSTLRIQLRDDFEIGYVNALPQLGSQSVGLRILSETWSASHDTVTLNVAGLAGAHYELPLRASQVIVVEGAQIAEGKLKLTIPSDSPNRYATEKIVLRFVPVH
jgi:hypothetical protein